MVNWLRWSEFVNISKEHKVKPTEFVWGEWVRGVTLFEFPQL